MQRALRGAAGQSYSSRVARAIYIRFVRYQEISTYLTVLRVSPIALLMGRIVGEKKRTSCLHPLPLRNAIRQASHEWKDEGANKIGGALETGRITNLGDDDDVTREPHFIAAQNETLVAYLL